MVNIKAMLMSLLIPMALTMALAFNVAKHPISLLGYFSILSLVIANAIIIYSELKRQLEKK